MNIIWGGMIGIGMLYGILTGQVEAVSEAVLSSAKEAVSLCITMVGIMAFWTGLMEIARESGLVKTVAKWIHPLLRILFPNIPEHHQAYESISANCVANILGLGWAATPAGLKAMEALSDLEKERRKTGKGVLVGMASNEMCTFLILNISSLQLIPVSVIAYRSQYGSIDPAGITGAAIGATAISTGAGILFCLLMNGKKVFRKKSK